MKTPKPALPCFKINSAVIKVTYFLNCYTIFECCLVAVPLLQHQYTPFLWHYTKPHSNGETLTHSKHLGGLGHTCVNTVTKPKRPEFHAIHRTPLWVGLKAIVCDTL